MKERLKDGSKMPARILANMYLHKNFIKTTIDTWVLNDNESNFGGLRHIESIERWQLTCHVIQDSKVLRS
jgi:hypothetical protein